jgi:amino acid transporter
LWIYYGFEQLSTVTEEVQHPTRNFPRALAIVVPLAVVVYFLPVAAGLAALGNWQSWQTGYLVTAAQMVGGRAMEAAMFAGAVICDFVLLDSTVLSVSRVPFTMAEDGYLHRSLARLHPRYGTPVLAIVSSTAACALLAVFSVTQLIAAYAWLRSATSTLTLLSLWRLRRSAPQLKRSFVVPGRKTGLAAVVIVPILLFAWALLNSDPTARLWGLAWLCTGPVFFLALRSQRPVANKT